MTRRARATMIRRARLLASTTEFDPTQPYVRRIIRKPEVRDRAGLSNSQIWRLERQGEFPARVLLSPSGLAVGWYEDEIDDWVESRPRANGKQPPLPKSRREAEPHASDDQAGGELTTE